MSESCRTCGAPIMWVPSFTSGKVMPLDLYPVPDGNVVLIETKDGPRAKVLGARSVRPAAASFYTTHFSTCPDAAFHRTSRGTSEAHGAQVMAKVTYAAESHHSGLCTASLATSARCCLDPHPDGTGHLYVGGGGDLIDAETYVA